MLVFLKITRNIIIISLLFCLGGCLSNRKNIIIAISDQFWNDTIHVDVASINNGMYQQYEVCSKEKYWKIDSKLRNNLYSKSFIFNINYPVKQNLLKNDSVWKFWKNDNYLIVLAELPKLYDDIPWKIIIPLEYYYWFNCWDDRHISIYISDQGIMRIDKKEAKIF